MKSTSRTYQGAASNPAAASWVRAIRGGERERKELLERITPARRAR